MKQIQRCEHFAKLHVKGKPCVLFNIWDAGSARAVEKAGAQAIATGSWSVAAAHGYDDGESIPLDLVEQIVQRICLATDLPVSIDFEGGYAKSAADVARNVQRIIDAGAAGINFEDQIVNGNGLYDAATQSKRIAAIREMADKKGIPLFINARTDLFLQAASDAEHANLIDDAIARAVAYKDAGASGLFVPGLIDEALIANVCEQTSLPVNVMMRDGVPPVRRLAELGVSRVSYGPSPYLQLMNELSKQAKSVFGK